MSRVLIIGAGPAGIRAAEQLVSAGVHPVVVDEGHRAGGQIYRQPPSGRERPARDLYGSEATKARALHTLFDQMRCERKITYQPQTSVTALFDGTAQFCTPEGLVTHAYDHLILATGAMDRLLPVPGWQAAGVYTLGGMQIALKAQGVALGRRIVLAGSGPLLTLVAAQLLKAGADVSAVLDTSPLRAQILGGATMALARPRVTLRGLDLRRQLGRRYHAGVQLREIDSDTDGVTALHWRDRRGRARRTDCDAIGLGWHLQAETHLAQLANVPFAWSEPWQQWLPQTDPLGRVRAGLYLAGDGLRIAGADAAEIAGRLAGVACFQDLGIRLSPSRQDLRQQARFGRFAKGLSRAFALPDPIATLPEETVICRCEGTTLAEIRAAVEHVGGQTNRVKSVSRAGMGRCQGRYCRGASAQIIAATTGQPLSALAPLRAQPPVRPLPVSACIADPRET